jgi:hypothetical protein
MVSRHKCLIRNFLAKKNKKIICKALIPTNGISALQTKDIIDPVAKTDPSYNPIQATKAFVPGTGNQSFRGFLLLHNTTTTRRFL